MFGFGVSCHVVWCVSRYPLPCFGNKEVAWALLRALKGGERTVVPITPCVPAEAIQGWRSGGKRFLWEFKQKGSVCSSWTCNAALFSFVCCFFF